MKMIRDNWLNHKFKFVTIMFFGIALGLIIPQVSGATLDAVMGWEVWLNTGNLNNLWQRKQAWDIPCPHNVYTHPTFADLDNDGDL